MKKYLRFTITSLVLLIMSFSVWELNRSALAVSLKQKGAFIKELNERLSNPTEARFWIEQHPSVAKGVFYELAFDTVASMRDRDIAPVTQNNWQCLVLISEALPLPSSHLTWLENRLRDHVKTPKMPIKFAPIDAYLQAIEQLHQRDWEAYERLMRQCLKESQRSEIIFGKAHAFLGLGLLGEIQGNDEEVVENYKKALSIFEQIQNNSGISQAHFRLYHHAQRIGQQDFKTGEYQEALKDFTRALKSANSLEDVAKQVAALTNMASAQQMLQKYHDAERNLQDALSRAEGRSDIETQRRLGFALNAFGVLERRQGHLRAAGSKLEKAQLLAEQLNDQRLLATTRHNLGSIHDRNGDLRRAIEEYHKAYDWYASLETPSTQEFGLICMSLGAAYTARKQFNEGLTYLQKAKAIFQDLKNWSLQAELMNHLGILAMMHQDIEGAVERYHEAIRLAKTRRYRSAQQTAHNNLGVAYVHIERYDKAIREFKKGLKLGDGIPEQQVTLLNGLGHAQYRLGKHKEAQKTLKQAEQLTRSGELLPKRWRSLFWLGSVYRAQRQPVLARRYWEEAVNIIESLRYNLGGSDRQRLLYMVDKGTVYASLADLLMQEPSDGAKAFEVIQRAKARTFLDMLYGSSVNLRIQAPAVLLDEEQQLELDMAARRGQMIAGIKESLLFRTETAFVRDFQRDRIPTDLRKVFQTNGIPLSPSATVESQDGRWLIVDKANGWEYTIKAEGSSLNIYESADQQIAKLKGRRVEVWGLLREQNPKYHQLFRGKIASLAHVQSKLDQSTVLLEYFVTDDRIFLFSISKEAAQVHRIPIDRQQLSEMVDKLRKVLESPVSTGMAAETDCRTFTETSSALYKVLFKPADKMLRQANHLIIAPHDLLYAIPFAALVVGKKTSRHVTSEPTPCAYTELDYLVRHYSLSYVPSGSVLWWLMGRPAKPAPKPKLLAIGHPHSSPLEPIGMKEIAMLRKLLHAKVLEGKEVTEARLKTLPLADYAVLHFAIHGIFDNDEPLSSHLDVGFSDDPTEDGQWHAYEILDSEVHARLVCLSGCATGRRPSVSGEGIVGLTRAFLSAGASSVLSSLWLIDDLPTTALMHPFYESLLQGKSNPLALQGAQRNLLKLAESESSNANLAHPRLWAGFVLYGNWQ